MYYMIAGLVLLVSYLIGSISASILISRRNGGTDIREEGSVKAVTTNMLRVHGKKAAVCTLLIDVGKGVLAVLIASAIDGAVSASLDFSGHSAYWLFFGGHLKYLAGIFAVLGHDFPIYFGFRGGKGVATSLGVVLASSWQVGLIVLAVALLVMVISRYVSLGSVCAGVLYPCALLAFMAGRGEIDAVAVICAIFLGALLIAKHHANLNRLMHGTENKLFAKKEQS